MKRQPTAIRREQIKKAVLEILSTEGLHQVSTRALAKKVGLSEGALFRHFTSKKAIMVAIMEDIQNDLIADLERIAHKQTSAPERLNEFLCAHVSYLIKNKGITILLFSEATHLNDNELKNYLHTTLNKQREFISQILHDGIKEGLWSPELNVENVAHLYLGIPITYNIEMVLNPKNFVADDFCKNMLCLLNRVLKK